jgi:hypothetical protein
MTMKYCPKCKQYKPYSEFAKSKDKKDGHHAYCKDCNRIAVNEWKANNKDRARELGRESRRRWRQRNPIESFLSNYKTYDSRKKLEYNLTVEWYIHNIQSKPCHYCGRVCDKMGCDRIDNSKGHTQDNCLPCCLECNQARSDAFTVTEMELCIGPSINMVKQIRSGKNLTMGVALIAKYYVESSTN